MIKGSYRAFTEICNLVIELIRQFYDLPRTFRITGENGQPDYVEFNNAPMQAQQTTEFGMDFSTKEPIFDIKVKAQRANPYSRTAQNELALQFYQLGFFNPQLTDQALATIDMMDFEGKEKVREMIRNNGTLYEQLKQAQQTNLQLAQLVAETTGEVRPLAALQQQMGMTPDAAPVSQGGMAAPQDGRSTFEKAAERASEVTAVR